MNILVIRLDRLERAGAQLLLTLLRIFPAACHMVPSIQSQLLEPLARHPSTIPDMSDVHPRWSKFQINMECGISLNEKDT